MSETLEQEGQNVASLVSKMVNNMCSDEAEDAFVDYILGDHRTLQQKSFKLFLKCIKTWAERGVLHTDARNEATYKHCKVMMDALVIANLAYQKDDGTYVIGIPFI